MDEDDTAVKLPKIRKDGEVDGRGRSEGSRSTQFAPGDGRKRPGRPKRSKDERTEICAIRDMPVPLNMNGRRRKVTTRFALFLKMRERALKGDQRAAEYLDKRMSQYEPIQTDPDLTAELLVEDQAILEAWATRAGISGHQDNGEAIKLEDPPLEPEED